MNPSDGAVTTDHTAAFVWLPASGAWRPEPKDEPELSRVVAMLTACADELKACEQVRVPHHGLGWRLTEAGKALAIARPRSSELEHG